MRASFAAAAFLCVLPAFPQEQGRRAERIENLAARISDPEMRQADPEALSLVMLELELLRPQAPFVARALASLLDFEKPWDRFSPDPKYPAIDALFKIGPAAVPALIDAIKKNDDHSRKFRNAVRTLRAIVAEDLPEGVVTLESEAAFAAELEAGRLRAAAMELRPMGFSEDQGKRSERVQKLAARLSDPEMRQADPEGLSLMMLELELMRPQAPVVVKALASLLEFEKPPDGFRPDPAYPTIDALFSIGPAAVPVLIDVIKASEEDTLKAKNAVHALRAIFRENLAEGLAALEVEAAFSSETEAKRLNRAGEAFKDWMSR